MDSYFSSFIGRRVINQSKEKIGTLYDLVVIDIAKNRPIITGMVIHRGAKKQQVYIPSHDIKEISPDAIRLDTDLVDLTPFLQKDNEVLLSENIYDRQIVDIDDRRLTRVNDLLLEQSKNSLLLKGVDVSFLGIMRRLGIPFGELFLKPNIVDWDDVQFLAGNEPVKFKIQYKNLESLHPVDIARIIFEGPGYRQGSRVLSALKDPIAADIIEELSPYLQRNLIESMPTDEVVDVINHMPADKAADLLLTLGSEHSQKILPLLEKEHSKTIQSLITYPDYSTGAFMTTDYLTIPAGNTIEQALDKLRKVKTLPDFVVYLYVLKSEVHNELVGVVSMHELLKTNWRSRVDTVMTKNIISTTPQDHIKKSLKKMYRYNVSALPVIDKSTQKLIGVVTFRDAISIYLPKRWKYRMRQVFSGGFPN